MRRDEIRPFRGDTESHLKRLRSFNPQPRLPIDRYEPPRPVQSLPHLDYAGPNVFRALRWVRVRMFGESVLKIIATILFGLLLLLAMCVLTGDLALILAVIACAGVPAMIWLVARATQRFH